MLHGKASVYDIYGVSSEGVNSLATVAVDATAPGTCPDLFIEVGEGVAVGGVVLNGSTGAPVGQARVEVTIPQSGTGGTVTIASATTSATGRFSLALALGSYSVVVSRRGYPPQSPQLLNVTGATTGAQFTMQPCRCRAWTGSAVGD